MDIMQELTMSTRDRTEKWYNKPFWVALVGSTLILVGNVVTIILPVIFQESSFSIDVKDQKTLENKYIIELDLIDPKSELQSIEEFNNITNLAIYSRFLNLRHISAKININNEHENLRKYGYPVHLRTVESPDDISVLFLPNDQKPPFISNMSIFIINPNKSIIDRPLTIQAVGGNGKIRNCTIYLDYFCQNDCMMLGNASLAIGNYKNAIKWYEKILDKNNCVANQNMAKAKDYLSNQ